MALLIPKSARHEVLLVCYSDSDDPEYIHCHRQTAPTRQTKTGNRSFIGTCPRSCAFLPSGDIPCALDRSPFSRIPTSYCCLWRQRLRGSIARCALLERTSSNCSRRQRFRPDVRVHPHASPYITIPSHSCQPITRPNTALQPTPLSARFCQADFTFHLSWSIISITFRVAAEC